MKKFKELMDANLFAKKIANEEKLAIFYQKAEAHELNWQKIIGRAEDVDENQKQLWTKIAAHLTKNTVKNENQAALSSLLAYLKGSGVIVQEAKQSLFAKDGPYALKESNREYLSKLV